MTTSPALTSVSIASLTEAALARHFSPGRAQRLKDLIGMGVSLSTVARARKVLDGFGVTPENDHEWHFYADWDTDIDVDGTATLQLWHQTSGTWIEVVYQGYEERG